MKENFDLGYFMLIFVGIVFFGLQIWWLSMTIRNGKIERSVTNKNKTDYIKKKLERIFLKTD